jgi:hypothetical protein
MDAMQAQTTATAQLDSNERLLWSGFPSPSRTAIAAIPAALFGIPFTAFAIFWISMAWVGTSRGHLPGPMAFFPLFGLPFVLIGVSTLLAPLWAYLGSSATTYAVTDKRVMIVTGRGSVRSLMPGDIGEIVRLDHAGGTGSLYFSPPGTVTIPFARATATRQSALIGITDARSVEQMIRENIIARRAA